MSTQSTIVRAGPPGGAIPQKLLEQYGCGPVQFTGTGDGLVVATAKELLRRR
jgi:hypothetical protein